MDKETLIKELNDLGIKFNSTYFRPSKTEIAVCEQLVDQVKSLKTKAEKATQAVPVNYAPELKPLADDHRQLSPNVGNPEHLKPIPKL